MDSDYSKRERTREAEQEFSEWVSHLQGKLFVILQIYADESGTHHPRGEQPGSEVPVISGYMAWDHEWPKSCPAWKDVLDKYHVKSFHAKEVENRIGVYSSWDDHDIDCFKYELAEIAGRHIPIGGAFHIGEYHRLNPTDDSYLYTHTIKQFFICLVETLNERQYSNEKISLIFDNGTGKKWNSAIIDEKEFWKAKGIRIGDHTYGDDEWILPLQMADMIAHRSRILHFKKLDAQAKQSPPVFVEATVFDIMLHRNLRPNRRFSPTITPALLNEMVELSGKHPSVNRALNELTATHFALKNEQRTRNNNRDSI